MDTKHEKLIAYFAIVLSIGIGLIIIFITSRSGIGVSPDSVSYIVAARDLFKVEFLKDYINWPPLFPLILGIINKIGIDPLISSRYLNAICMSGIIYLGYQYLKLLKLKTYSIGLGLLLLFFSYPLLYCSIHLWTEPLFVFWTMLIFYSGIKYLQTLGWRWLILLIAATALTTLTRYTGIIYMCVGLSSIIFSSQSLRSKWTAGIIYVITSLIPIGIWFIRNYLTYNLFREFFGFSQQTIWDNIQQTYATIVKWFVPIPFSYIVPSLIVFGIGGLLLFVFSKRNYLGKNQIWLMESPELKINIIFVGIYLLYLILFVSREAIDVIGDRYLIAVFIPIVVIITIYINQFLSVITKRIIPITIILFIFEIAYFSIRFTRLSLTTINSDIRNYTSESWQNSSTINYLKSTTDISGLYLSNNVFPVKVNTLIRPIASPRKYYYNSNTSTEDLKVIKDKLTQQGLAKLIWFINGDIASNYYSLDELKTKFNFIGEIKLDDGIIYTIKNQ